MKKEFDLWVHSYPSLKKLIMELKIAFLIVLVSVSTVVANPTYSQVAKVSLDFQNKRLEQVMDEIERQSEFYFIFNQKQINVNRLVDIKSENKTIIDILPTLFSGTNVNYEVLDRKILLTTDQLDKSIKATETIAELQQATISGTITDATTGEVMPGVNIVVPGTNIGTMSDASGKFSLGVPNASVKLQFSFIGYITKEVTLNGQSKLNVTMTSDVATLSEVVIVGYGTVKKSDVTGSLSHVDEKVLQETPVQNVIQALQGMASGVDITTNIKPGELPPITIRGNRSMQASNEPLYVVDGIPLAAGNMSDYNPNDITSVEVLKDASATAIYGSRGANGVLLITTRKGTKGKVTVNYNTTISLDSYKSLSQYETGGEYIDRQRMALMNGRNYNSTTNTNLNVPATLWYPDPNLDIQKLGLSTDMVAQESVLMGYDWVDGIVGGTVVTRPTTALEQEQGWPAQVPVYNSANVRSFDWRKAVTRQGVTQNHQLSLSAGTETARIYTSFAYLNQLGVQKDQDYKRYNLIINGDITPNKWLTVGTSINGSMSLQNFGVTAPSTQQTGSKDIYSRATDQLPYAMPRNASGAYIYNPGGSLSVWNPLIDINQSINERRVSAIISSLYGEIKFTPWLKYRLNIGAQIRQNRTGAWTGSEATSHLVAKPNTAAYNTSQSFALIAENIVSLDKTFAENHTIGITLLQSSQSFRNEGIYMSGSSMIYNTSKWYDIASNLNGKPDTYGTSFTENKLESYMARANYSLMNKYLLTLTGRWDGASVLAPGNKWDFFPSFSLAWKLQEETFIRDIIWIDVLKLRFGYGVTGNSAVAPYSTSGPVSKNPYVFGSVPYIGYLPQIVPNPSLGWEKTSQSNLGLDFAFLKSRISGSIDIYKSNTSDLILNKTLPAVSGFISKIENIGKTSNQGIEITLSTVNVRKNNFKWSTDITFAANKEKIVELISKDVNGKPLDILANRWFIGQPTQVYYSYQSAGIWQNTPEDLAEMAKFNANSHRFYPGTVKVVDQNGDYKINGEDMVILGTNRPKWTGGITNNFTYKGFDLKFFVYFRMGQMFFGGPPVQRDTWSWDNPNGRFPMPNSGLVENNAFAGLYNDASYVAVRNISLSYTLPTNFLKLKISNLQVTCQVLNPFLFGGDAVKFGLNPEDVTTWDVQNITGAVLGGQNNNTIINQSFVFGLRVGF
jgi:TonB-linked SusC/RagA family outer membrane protein